MVLTRLSLTDFRNHEAFELESEPGFVVLYGPNGAGKTNILEAISLLVPGRGLRRAILTDMARHDGKGGFSISAELDDVKIGTGTEAAAPERRKVRINGANATANALAEWLSILWLTPTMDRIFIEGAGARRRFLDRLVLALKPDHARLCSRYEAAMRERNRLLTGDRRPDAAWLDALEVRMAEVALPIIHARAKTVSALDSELSARGEGPFAIPKVEVTNSVESDEAEMIRKWRDGRSRDSAAGRTLTGPHRADLAITHRAKGEAAARCSTGEQKALLLSIILAHAGLVSARRGTPPLLLLDEVAAHLDPSRRAALFHLLAELGGQVWMTGTEAGLFDALGNDVLRVPLSSRTGLA